MHYKNCNKSCIYAQTFQTTVVYSSDLFTHNAKCLPTLFLAKQVIPRLL